MPCRAVPTRAATRAASARRWGDEARTRGAAARRRRRSARIEKRSPEDLAPERSLNPGLVRAPSDCYPPGRRGLRDSRRARAGRSVARGARRDYLKPRADSASLSGISERRGADSIFSAKDEVDATRCSGCGAHMNDTTGLPLRRRPRSRFGFGGVTSTPIMALRKNKRRVHEIIKFWFRCGARLLNDGAQLLSWKSARKRSPGGRGATARATLCTEAPAFRPMRLSHRQMYALFSSRLVAYCTRLRMRTCGYDAVGLGDETDSRQVCVCPPVRPSGWPSGPPPHRTSSQWPAKRRGAQREITLSCVFERISELNNKKDVFRV